MGIMKDILNRGISFFIRMYLLCDIRLCLEMKRQVCGLHGIRLNGNFIYRGETGDGRPDFRSTV